MIRSGFGDGLIQTGYSRKALATNALRLLYGWKLANVKKKIGWLNGA
jgi:hypothetical protein